MFSVAQLAVLTTYILLRVGNSQTVLSQLQWQEPFFEDPHTEGVQWHASDPALGIQTINVQEELSVPYKLAKVNYNGTTLPSLGAFDIGDNSLLGARINYTDNEWFIIIEKRQDYENPQQRIYFFQIFIKGVFTASVVEPSIFIKLENIFDNQPTLTYSPSPCRIEELHTNYTSECIFSVYDPDGMDRNNIRIEAKSHTNENMIFNFVDYGEITTYERQYKLKILKELHYEEKAIYNLDVKVYDANNNTGGIFAILEVIDLANRNPIWIRPLTTATIDEKEEQFFSLKAIDGDTGIDKPICYKLEFEEDYSGLISINSSTGVLHIQPIDRDLLRQQIFSFYTCAYKCHDPSWLIKNSTILIVQDINDHKPEITVEPKSLRILESTHLTLPLEKFFIEDLDLGSNATYNVFLASSNGNINYAQEFNLIPNSGYQRTEFSLTVTDQLDYENENWRKFDLEITVQEIEDVAHHSKASLSIELINWNDEWPLFDHEFHKIQVYENVTRGTELARIQATDKDIGDKVIHSIVGSVQGMAIDSSTGLIFLNQPGVFDFERQSLVILQIQAKDSLITDYKQNLHTSYTQLQIEVLDVNDETPELRLPRFIVNITENSPALTLITDKIEARDPDTSANLIFEILWSESHATKSGQAVEKSYFGGCFKIENEIINNNLVYGHMKINDEFHSQVDYEKYDTIFLAIRVKDLNQELNEDSTTAVLTIRIDDLNDNPPQFISGTLKEERSVTELEEVMSTIGTIQAYDVDGIGNNNITYKLRPLNTFTAIEQLSINSTTGVIKVANLIQCDVPKIYYLEYEVIASDFLHETIGKLNISVIDINNQPPVLDEFEQQVFIFENATTGTVVGQVKAHDNDRDSPHNILEFTINSALGDLHNFFLINSTNGEVKVNLRNGYTLDRDMGTTFYLIPIDVRDNFNFLNSGYGPVNQKSTFLNVTLKDVNDNAPIMPAGNQYKTEFSEADGPDTISKLDFIAEDLDEPNTPNSDLKYTISSIKPVHEFNPNVQGYGDLFTITTLRNLMGRLRTQKSLKGYYGLWEIEIEASDQGTPQLKNSSVYEIYIKPYNFHVPKIVYPVEHKSIRICYALQEPLRPLYQADCVTRLKSFEIYDPDGGEYGDVHFEMTSDGMAGHDKYFELIKESRNLTSFYVKQLLKAGIYSINLRSIDGGGSTSSEIRHLKIVFVDMLGNPMFLQSSFKTDFTENEQGLLEERLIPPAYDPKNEGLDDSDETYKLYYFIEDSFHPDDAKLFVLNSETGVLKLNSTLDRETVGELSIRIKVSNNRQGLIANPNSVNYTLLVNITVNDVNDNVPKFTQELYAAGITTKDAVGKHILTVQADDLDLNDDISYGISYSSYETHGENLVENNMDFFSLDQNTGILQLNSYVTNKMKGYFKFSIEAFDLAGHLDRASVKIYIVSETNRVKFVFLSDIQAIRTNEKFLREKFQQIYGYEICNIDSIDDVTNMRKQKFYQNTGNSSTAFITEVKVHFINNNEAVEAYDIQRRSNDLAFISLLQNSLQYHNLILNDIPHIESETQTTFMENWLVMALVGLNVILGSVSAIMSALYIVKIRTLKRQLKAFEPAEFGSIASNLNRIAGPSMNIFSVEGSNPVFKKQTNEINQNGGVYDDETSSDSEDDEEDFTDLHDDPLFEMNNAKSFENSDKTATNNFEHKILNNDFFNTKDKSTNLEKDFVGTKRF